MADTNCKHCIAISYVVNGGAVKNIIKKFLWAKSGWTLYTQIIPHKLLSYTKLDGL